MHKFSFTVDIVTDSPVNVDPNSVRNMLLASVEGVGNIAAVHPFKSEALKEQGFKVWRARVAGIKEPAKVKVPKVKATEPATA